MSEVFKKIKLEMRWVYFKWKTRNLPHPKDMGGYTVRIPTRKELEETITRSKGA